MLVGYYPLIRGGAEQQAHLIASYLRNSYDVFFISIGHESDQMLLDNGYKIYAIKPIQLAGNKMYFLARGKILNILKHEKPDFIYQAVSYSATGIAAEYCKNAGSKLIWHIASDRDVAPSKFGRGQKGLFYFIEDKYAEYGKRHAAYIIAQTEQQKQTFFANYRRTCDIILRNFHPVPEDIIKKQLPFKVTWIANIKKLKQPEIFIKLCHELRHKKDVNFLMIGRKGPSVYQNQLNFQIRTCDNLNFLGELDIEEVNRILAESHIFVNTSLYEGFPNTFIQAWMRQVPVVSLNVDPDGILCRQRIGFHSKTFDQMLQDVVRLIEDEPLRLDMGERARSFAEKEFSMRNLEMILPFFR